MLPAALILSISSYVMYDFFRKEALLSIVDISTVRSHSCDKFYFIASPGSLLKPLQPNSFKFNSRDLDDNIKRGLPWQMAVSESALLFIGGPCRTSESFVSWNDSSTTQQFLFN